MRALLIATLLTCSSLFAQSSATVSKSQVSEGFKRPKSLRSLEFSLKGSYQQNPGRVETETAKARGFKESQLQSEVLELDLNTKWIFKPFKKFIMIDTFKISSLLHSNLEEERIPFENRLELKNDLVGVYVLDRNNQIGNLLRTNIIRGNSFQISDRPGIQELNDNHFMIQNMVFYQHKFGKTYSIRFDAGGKLIDFEDTYSSFTRAEGEQNDHLAGILSIENKWKIDNVFSFKIPLTFRREFYKNRIALNQNGSFNFNGLVRERDDIEVYEAGTEFSFNLPEFKLTAGITAVQQVDNVQGGRSYEGYRAILEATIPNENVELSAKLALNDFDYDTALVDATATNPQLWIQRGYSVGAKAKVPMNNGVKLLLSAERDVAENNFFAGAFENDILQVGVEYNL